MVRGCLRGEETPGRHVARILMNDGRTKWLELRVDLIEWEDKPAMLGFYADITERTRPNYGWPSRING